MACALLLAPPAARADDSLLGKAMNSIGLGGDGSPNQNAAAPQQPAAPAPQPAPASGDNQNLLTNWFGWGRHNPPQPTDQAAVEPQRKALTPVQAPPAPAPAPTVAPTSLWDQMLGNSGLNTHNAVDNIYYADRPKLNVPKQRALPQPGPEAGTAGVRPSNPADLLQPPDGYLEKARGADGNVSGLHSGDIDKDKKFFGLF
jgi:hypothetical protein